MKHSNRPQYDDDDWMDEDDLKHARKNHQNHRNRNRGARHNDIEKHSKQSQKG
ncbi:MAG: hypothetical protein CENE_00766 [Candidatus Celerinatantimonas neptuna]|nr:MAG: hypothetical protein CENE_00766 [Candidatus Celerinatantimonas neptuna]